MSEHNTPSVEKQNAPVTGIPSFVYFGIFATMFLILIVFLIGSCSSEEDENTLSSKKKKTRTLVLRYDEFAPCDLRFDYEFELDTQGDSISLKFPGVAELIKYSGKGKIEVPDYRKKGKVQINSLNPSIQARVRVWEVIWQ